MNRRKFIQKSGSSGLGIAISLAGIRGVRAGYSGGFTPSASGSWWSGYSGGLHWPSGTVQRSGTAQQYYVPSLAPNQTVTAPLAYGYKASAYQTTGFANTPAPLINPTWWVVDRISPPPGPPAPPYYFGRFVASGKLSADASLPYSSSANTTFLAATEAQFSQFQSYITNTYDYYPFYPYRSKIVQGVVAAGTTKNIDTFPYASTPKTVDIAPGLVKFAHFHGHNSNYDLGPPLKTEHYPGPNVGGYIREGILSGNQSLSFGDNGTLSFLSGTVATFQSYQNMSIVEGMEYPVTAARGYLTSGYLASAQSLLFKSGTSITAATGFKVEFTRIQNGAGINSGYNGWVSRVKLGANVILPKGASKVSTQYYAGDIINVSGTGGGATTPDRYVLSSTPTR